MNYEVSIVRYYNKEHVEALIIYSIIVTLYNESEMKRIGK